MSDEIKKELKITYRPITELKILPLNFKTHDLVKIESSIMTRGMIDPIGFNPTTGNAFDGNGRTEILTAMFAKWRSNPDEQVIPAYVKVKKNVWLVPTVDVSMTETEEVAAAAMLNKAALDGGFDNAMMLETLEYLKEQDALKESGYDGGDLDRLLKLFPKATSGGAMVELGGSGGGESGGEGDDFDENGDESGRLPASTAKQIGLLYNQAQTAEFTELVTKLAKAFDKPSVAEVVLEALRRAERALNTEKQDDDKDDTSKTS